MSKSRNKKKKGKFHIAKWSLILALVFGVVALVGFSSVSLAKYYAKRDNKGVSVAAGLYFNSNCISNIPGEINLTLDTVDLTTVPGYVNPEGGSIFYLDIRNYDNHLLYNELYLDLEYTIQFLKVNGQSATVEYTDDAGQNQMVLLEDGKEFKLTGRRLNGGSAKYERYTINTEQALDGSNAQVLVMAYPTSPDYVAVAGKEMRLIGILQAQPKDVKVGIDRDYFMIEDTAEYATEWKAAVEAMSGLVYNIQTNGDNVSSSGAVQGEMKVTWNAKMLDINQYDTHYVEALENNSVVTEGDMKTMTIRVLPYANVKITFYKTKDFVSAFNGSMTKEEFENYVSATLVSSDD